MTTSFHPSPAREFTQRRPRPSSGCLQVGATGAAALPNNDTQRKDEPMSKQETSSEVKAGAGSKVTVTAAENFGHKLVRVPGTNEWVEEMLDGRRVPVKDPTTGSTPGAGRAA
jgi:hypothetical protein